MLSFVYEKGRNKTYASACIWKIHMIEKAQTDKIACIQGMWDIRKNR